MSELVVVKPEVIENEMTEEQELAYIERWMGEDTAFIPKKVLGLLSKYYPELYEEDEFALDEGELPECMNQGKPKPPKSAMKNK